MEKLVVVLTNVADRAVAPTPIIQDLTNKVFNLQFATALPGGFMSCTLSVLMPRSRAYEWYERFLLYGVNIYEGDDPVWEGRISAIALKDYGVDVTCEGYWASLTDQTLYSWWNDNDMSKWKIPQPGSGYVGAEITLLGANYGRKFNATIEQGFALINTVKGTIYNLNDKGVIYYRLPHVNELSDKRLFQPMTIHSILYTLGTNALDTNLEIGIWTAPFATDVPGSWNKRADMYQGTEFVNLEANEADIEVVALGLGVTGAGFTEAHDTGEARIAITDVVVYAERDATRTNKTTSKKILTGLLLGDADIDVDTHAKQISADMLSVEGSDLEIVPANFDRKTIQEILVGINSFGIVQEQNLIQNPGCETESPKTGGKVQDWHRNQVPFTNVDRLVDSPTEIPWISHCAKLTIDATGLGIVIQASDYREDMTWKMPVDENLPYTFSAWVKHSLAGKQMRLKILWYEIDNVTLISTDYSGSFFATTSWARYSTQKTSPALAAFALVEIAGQSQTGYDLRATAAQLEQTQVLSEEYCDGGRADATWAGIANLSPTVSVDSPLIGVYGRNRLHVEKRKESQVRWVVSMKEVAAGGAELERTSQDLWTRVWAKYTGALDNLEKFTDVNESPLELALFYDQRDQIVELQQLSEAFANLAAQVALEDLKRPLQRTEITLSGSITDALGCRQPLWRVRSGDVILIHDLVPLSTPRKLVYTGRVTVPAMLDKLRTFVIRETEYDVRSNQLQLVPDLPPNRLDLLMSKLSTTPTLSSIGQGNLDMAGFGAGGIGSIPMM